jgi:peptidoglycan/xylan/chitin deacetylase (PgdA/CDA1 family)
MHTSILYPIILVVLLLAVAPTIRAQSGSDDFSWPEGKQAAVSLTFDDGRASQVKTGTPLFNEHDVDVTFYVVPPSVEENLAGWKEAVAAGHEIGNHSMSHPCTGNFSWSRDNALETYTLDRMRTQLQRANDRIEELLGVRPESFAYPCGQTFVGRGEDTKSYVPLVAELFASGRGWLDEGPNDPMFCDLAQLTGMSMDASDFDEIKPLLEEARESGRWLVLAGHDIGQEGSQTTRVGMLEKLMAHAQNPDNRIWLAPVGTIAEYVKEQRD